jgi:multidrug efflux pump
VLAVFFVPAFFVFVIGMQERIIAWRARRRAGRPSAQE